MQIGILGLGTIFALASPDLAARAISCPSYREVGTSDHAPVIAAFGG